MECLQHTRRKIRRVVGGKSGTPVAVYVRLLPLIWYLLLAGSKIQNTYFVRLGRFLPFFGPLFTPVLSFAGGHRQGWQSYQSKLLSFFKEVLDHHTPMRS